MIADGISVNVTLIFSVAMYEQVMQAYLEGLKSLRAAGKPLGLVSSVASFFISRIDNVIDPILDQRIAAGEPALGMLRGQAAIANAKIAYDCYKSVFESAAFADLKAAGQVQRPLWAAPARRTRPIRARSTWTRRSARTRSTPFRRRRWTRSARRPHQVARSTWTPCVFNG